VADHVLPDPTSRPRSMPKHHLALPEPARAPPRAGHIRLIPKNCYAPPVVCSGLIDPGWRATDDITGAHSTSPYIHAP
jgi:hypothetical protein